MANLKHSQNEIHYIIKIRSKLTCSRQAKYVEVVQLLGLRNNNCEAVSRLYNNVAAKLDIKPAKPIDIVYLGSSVI